MFEKIMFDLIEFFYSLIKLLIFVIVECLFSIYTCIIRIIFIQLTGEKSLQWTQRFLIYYLSKYFLVNWIRTKRKRNAIISVHGKKTSKVKREIRVVKKIGICFVFCFRFCPRSFIIYNLIKLFLTFFLLLLLLTLKKK